MQQFFEQKLGRAVLILLVVFLGVQTLSIFKNLGEPSAAYNTIVVTGQGESFAAPDVASFSFSVSADAKTVGSAQDTVTEKTNAILEALKGMSIEEKDIRTTDYSVYPKYTYESTVCAYGGYCPPTKQVPDGYTVTHTILIKVRATADAGQALSLAGANGASNISSLTFTIDDPDMVMNEARDEAVAEAKTKAKALAKSLGVRLGRVVDFSDSTYGGVYPTMYRGEAMSMGMGGADSKAIDIPTGENKVSSSVTITYEIR
jgi:uncharacterized protein YggE